DSYSLSDLARVSGAKKRSLQLWADSKVIIAHGGTDRAGTGTHRQFSRGEAIVACIVQAFAQHQIAIGELLRIAAVVRSAIQAAQIDDGAPKGHRVINLVKGRKNRLETRAIVEAAIRGEGNATLVYESWAEEKDGLGPMINIYTSPEAVEFY